tara:strand:+ start:8500 stop:8733 length:234 start_codon:yes stop_codon:yes gene_type:complete
MKDIEALSEQDYIWAALDDLQPAPRETLKLPKAVTELETEEISHALAVHKGNRTRAANALGIGRTNLIAKMRKYEMI